MSSRSRASITQNCKAITPEMRARMNDCKFNDCVHYHEPGCAIRAAVEAGDIAQTRYNTYVSMLTALRPKLLKT